MKGPIGWLGGQVLIIMGCQCHSKAHRFIKHVRSGAHPSAAWEKIQPLEALQIKSLYSAWSIGINSQCIELYNP